jgi:hypothetical protein
MTKETKYLDERRIRRFVTFVGTLFAIAFLIGAMWALWCEGNHMIAKLATVTELTVAFAGWVASFTTAQRCCDRSLGGFVTRIQTCQEAMCSSIRSSVLKVLEVLDALSNLSHLSPPRVHR